MDRSTTPDVAATRRDNRLTGDVLDRRTLNRALLERQMLLQRQAVSAEDAIEHLIGMQSQAPNPPYLGLWTRLEDFQHEKLSRMMLDRRMVRMALMRSTIHLVSARDSLMLRPLVQPVLDRSFKSNYGKLLIGTDLQEIEKAGRELVDERPRTFKEIGDTLAQRWPDRDPAALGAAIRTLVPLVQVPPRGVWGASGPAAHTSVETWLGQPPDPEPSPDEMVLRYLAAFGPATVKDIQNWSGLTRLNEVVKRIRPQLRTYQDEHGKELFDLVDATLPHPDTPAPPRFIPEFDNLLLSHADRTRIISEEHRPRVFTINGIIKGTILVDGFVGGIWNIDRQRDEATLIIQHFDPLPAEARDALAEEGFRLLAFATDETPEHNVQVVQFDT